MYILALIGLLAIIYIIAKFIKMFVTSWKADTAMREHHIEQIKGLFEKDKEFEKETKQNKES